MRYEDWRTDSIYKIVNDKKITINMTEPKKFTEDKKTGYHKKYYVLQKYICRTMYWGIDEDTGERELDGTSASILEISECNYKNGNISFNCGVFLMMGIGTLSMIALELILWGLVNALLQMGKRWR